MFAVRRRRREGFRERCRDLTLFHLIDAQRRRDLMSHDVITLGCQIENERSTTGSATAVIRCDHWTAPNVQASASENDLQYNFVFPLAQPDPELSFRAVARSPRHEVKIELVEVGARGLVSVV